MHNKIVLNLFCNKIPCEILIVTLEGNLIKQITVNSICSKICFCTNQCNVIIMASFKNETIQKTLCLNNDYENIELLFNPSRYESSKNVIKLFDANYGFPVAKAQLIFRK